MDVAKREEESESHIWNKLITQTLSLATIYALFHSKFPIARKGKIMPRKFESLNMSCWNVIEIKARAREAKIAHPCSHSKPPSALGILAYAKSGVLACFVLQMCLFALILLRHFKSALRAVELEFPSVILLANKLNWKPVKVPRRIIFSVT